MALHSRRMPVRSACVTTSATLRRMVLPLLQAAALAFAIPHSPSAAQDLPSVPAVGDSSRECPGSFAAHGQWLVRAGIGGGISGRFETVTIDASRKLEASRSHSAARCTVQLGYDQVRSIEELIARSQPEQWRKTYDAEGETCCDRIVASLKLELGEAGGKRSFATGWLISANEHKVPEEIRRLFAAVVGAEEVCSFTP